MGKTNAVNLRSYFWHQFEGVINHFDQSCCVILLKWIYKGHSLKEFFKIKHDRKQYAGKSI